MTEESSGVPIHKMSMSTNERIPSPAVRLRATCLIRILSSYQHHFDVPMFKYLSLIKTNF